MVLLYRSLTDKRTAATRPHLAVTAFQKQAFEMDDVDCDVGRKAHIGIQLQVVPSEQNKDKEERSKYTMSG